MSATTQARIKSLGLSPECLEVLCHLWDYLDDEMTPASAERLRSHIEQCPQCREYEGFQSCFLEAMTRLKAQLHAPETVREKVAEKLRDEGCGCWERARKGGCS